MIEQTAYAASPFDTRYELGVKLENFGAPGDATNVRMMATDGARLAAAIGEAEPGLPPGRCAIVPREALATILLRPPTRG
jgi:DNA polymerase III sliding clamp (beta) subunit (PCNA family)